MYQTTKDHNGNIIYRGFDFPKSLEGLDIEIVNSTLNYLLFIAAMSDDYSRTVAEENHINSYQAQHPELLESRG